MIPISGWLARVMSTRWLFAASAAGFTVMSLACAFAWDTNSMIVFRALQGFIGGGMIPTVFAANFRLFPPERQMMGTVIIGLTATVAPSIGPTLGGWLTENYSWHWLFLANIVPGAVVTVAVPLLVDIDRPDWGLFRKIDLPGIALVAGFLGSAELVPDEGPRNDWFEDGHILAFAIVSVLSGVLLVWRELTVEHPVLELQAFRNRNFTVGCVLTFVLGICLYGQSFILPQLLGQVRGYNAMQIGEVMWVTGLAMFLTAPVAGRLASALDPRKVLAVGFVLTAAGLYLNAQMTPEVGFWELFWGQAVRGAGLILIIVPITDAALGTLPAHLVGGGSGLFTVFRNMGGAVGLAMIDTQWDGRYDRHYWWLVESLSSTRAVVADRLDDLAARLGASAALASDADLAAVGQLARSVATQANVMAWNDVFLMLAVLFCLALPLVLLLARPGNTNVAAH